MKKIGIISILSVLIITLLSGCNFTSNSQFTPTAEVIFQATATLTLTPTMTTPTLTSLPTTVSRLRGQVSIISLNLRDGPGTVHGVLGNYPNGTGVIALSKTPGGEWIKVETTDNNTGWMYRSLMKIEGAWQALPEEEKPDDHKIRGIVVDSAGVPINLITIAISQIIDGNEQRTDAQTGEDGTFHAYLPAISQGIWSVQVVGIGCKSRIASAECTYSGFFENFGQAIIALPQSDPITFTYRE